MEKKNLIKIKNTWGIIIPEEIIGKMNIDVEKDVLELSIEDSILIVKKKDDLL